MMGNELQQNKFSIECFLWIKIINEMGLEIKTWNPRYPNTSKNGSHLDGLVQERLTPVR